jgi:hypothetical protein
MTYFVVLNKRELVSVTKSLKEARKMIKDKFNGLIASLNDATIHDFDEKDIHLNLMEIKNIKYIYHVLETNYATELEDYVDNAIGLYNNEKDILRFQSKHGYTITMWENCI